MSEISTIDEINQLIIPNAKINLGYYSLELKIPFTPVYDEDGFLTQFDVFIIKYYKGFNSFVNLEKEELFKDIVASDIKELNWHLKTVPLCMPVYKLHKTTIKSIIFTIKNLVEI